MIYGYFSGATPSAMAQVFLAYGCRYAMLLDMNALEHTYMALYRRQGDRFSTQHLIAGMSVLDEMVGGQQLPRFVAFADNRDFFYLSAQRRASDDDRELWRLLLIAITGAWLPWSSAELGVAGEVSFEAQNEALLRAGDRRSTGFSDAQLSAVREVFRRSGFVGQGNPRIARHPATPEDCGRSPRALPARKLRAARAFDAACAAPGTWRRSTIPPPRTAGDARTCIDRFEFPNIPCAYPVVWVRAREAAELCAAVGKRLCDAHEWEGRLRRGPDRRPTTASTLAAGRDAVGRGQSHARSSQPALRA